MSIAASDPGSDIHAAEMVALADLDLSLRLRRSLDPLHVAVLAEVIDRCPPVLVARSAMLLLDGHMRVAAARSVGRVALPVCWVDADQATAMETAAAANTAHGLPLTREERVGAARRLLELAPSWGNRRLASSCGVSEATVRRVRAGASLTQVDGRLGRDGKVYPVGTQKRQQARTLLEARPDASDRAIARECGLSPTTIGRIRRQSGQLPVAAPPVLMPSRRRWRRWLRALLRHLWRLLCRR